MEEIIERMIDLIKSKKKIREMNIFVPSVAFAKVLVANAERELDYHNISSFTPKVDLNIYVAEDPDEEDNKEDSTE